MPICGAELQGEYCSRCGQHDLREHGWALSHFLHEFTHELTHLDSKIFRTLKLLLFPSIGQFSIQLNSRRERLMNSKSRLSTTLAIVLGFVYSAPTYAEPIAANLCRVFASPADYNHKRIVIEGVISPSIHSLFLSGPGCKAEGDGDFSIQAVLPRSWESLPNGKALRKFLRRSKSASVKLTGTFEADPQRYGPDGARFRFVIAEISAVQAAPPGFHL